MAPRSARDHGDHRADIFAFGAVLYEMPQAVAPSRPSPSNAARSQDGSGGIGPCRHRVPTGLDRSSATAGKNPPAIQRCRTWPSHSIRCRLSVIEPPSHRIHGVADSRWSQAALAAIVASALVELSVGSQRQRPRSPIQAVTFAGVVGRAAHARHSSARTPVGSATGSDSRCLDSPEPVSQNAFGKNLVDLSQERWCVLRPTTAACGARDARRWWRPRSRGLIEDDDWTPTAPRWP